MKFHVLISFALFTLAIVACSGQPQTAQSPSAQTGTPSAEGLRPLITTSEMLVGQNRFAFALMKGTQFIEDANVSVRVYEVNGNQAVLRQEEKAAFLRPELAEKGEHVHGDTQSDALGIYVTQLNFTNPGQWGLEVLVKQSEQVGDGVRIGIEVLEKSKTPAVGALAPRSRNLIASDVTNLSEIDTSDPPNPRLHQMRIADAIAQGKPQIIAFATPKYCATRVCGPVVELMSSLMPKYGDRVAFTHQEIWQDFGAKKPFQTVEEWGLETEPWIFLVDGTGTVRAKFEGLATAAEMDTALKQMLEQG